MNNHRHFWLYALAFFIFSLPVLAKEPLLATGTFVLENDQRPLLALHFNQDQHWEYPASVYENPLPKNYFTGASLMSSTCKAALCLAAGYYYDPAMRSQPLMALSDNAGQDWRYLKLPEQNGSFKSIACGRNTCFSAGSYENYNALEYPLLAIGMNNWNYANEAIKQAMPADFHAGKFEDIACSEATCIATGYYQNSANLLRPFLLRTEDEGKHWQDPHKTLPPDFISGTFTRIACQGQFCITAGSYSDKEEEKPLISLSYDGGKHWQSPELSFADDFIRGRFSGVHCTNQFCIAVGLYENASTTLPLLLYTDNQGKTWTFAEYISHSGLPAGTEDAELRQAACANDFCIAVGYYHDRIGAHPLIAVSADQGKTWDYPESATTSVPEADVGDGEFVHASCRENTCIAVGNYLRDDRRFPLLAMSTNKGKIWEFVPAIADRRQLPAGFIFGQFEASS